MDDFISVRGAKEHNLKNVSVDIPRNQFVVITGLSGSGKSSLAFDTIYAEGQRRYVESLSSYARQFLEMQDKPDVESITGLSPAIAIEQKTTSKNPRSTVATITEIYDYLRLLFSRIGVPYSPATGKPIEKQSVSQMVDRVLEVPEKSKIYILAPIVRGGKGEHRKELLQLKKNGFTRVKIDGKVYMLDKIPPIDKNKKHNIEVVVDRLVVSSELGNRLPSSIETALQLSKGLLYIDIVSLPEEEKSDDDKDEGEKAEDKSDKKIEKKTGNKIVKTFAKGDVIILSEKFSCPESGFQLAEIEPRIFSFNSPYGACNSCDGLGTELFFDPTVIVPDETLSLLEGAILPWANMQSKMYIQTLKGLANHYDFKLTTKYRSLSDEIKNILMYGTGSEEIAIEYEDGVRTYTVTQPFEGIIYNMERRWKETDSVRIRDELDKYQNLTDCRSCKGYRLKEEILCVKIAERHIGEICQMTIEDAAKWIENLPTKLGKKDNAIAERVIQELVRRIGFLNNVGLDYLTLARKSGTLSGGESQRIRLASQIGAGLSGVLYVLDEPSIGLHQCDNSKLLKTLKSLKDLGNTVIVVEHDEDTMRQSDYLIDIGPAAGVHGGKIVAEGTPDEVINNPASVTGMYLKGEKYIQIPKPRKVDIERCISIRGARENNLNNVDVDIPLKNFVAITGVSGGGKSSLILKILYRAVAKQLNGNKNIPGQHDKILGLEYIDKIIQIDQSPIGRTPRSNPATYTGAFSPIRDLFVNLPEAKARGYKAGRFSFNVKGGRCETCQGDGLIKIEMHFLPDVYVNCEGCNGARYNRETLEIKYKGKSISDILQMTVEEGEKFFKKVPLVYEKLNALNEVGVGYIKLGQSATTLSGGEAQRIKLAKELAKKSTGRTLYILDEPTTGLHSDDIAKLLHVLHKLVDTGNSVLVIEHNLDVIKTADWIIDIGPGGGSKGGFIVAEGTPKHISECKESVTGDYLKQLLADGVYEEDQDQDKKAS